MYYMVLAQSGPLFRLSLIFPFPFLCTLGYSFAFSYPHAFTCALRPLFHVFLLLGHWLNFSSFKSQFKCNILCTATPDSSPYNFSIATSSLRPNLPDTVCCFALYSHKVLSRELINSNNIIIICPQRMRLLIPQRQKHGCKHFCIHINWLILCA
jgi:hypothetical protein